MRIAFLVNSIEGEETFYATTSLALAGLARGHEVLYVTPGDFALRADGRLMIHALSLGAAKPRKAETFIAALKGDHTRREVLDIADVQVLFLRNDPSEDTGPRPWAAQAGVIFGRLAAERGAIVVNDADGLALAQNKLYLQDFPEVVRPTTLISKHIEEVRAFVDEHPEGVILKPLQGSGGRNVFKVSSSHETNLNQIFEAVSEMGYVIAQEYLPAASEGDVRLFLMNGRPLKRGDTYAAVRRVPAEGDLRSNMHANGTAAPAVITPEMLAVAEQMRPKLVRDGMFLVGLDVVGDRLVEVNVFTPGALPEIAELTSVDFSEDIVAALERKLSIKQAYAGALSNRELATL
ncbi:MULTISPECIES: glutathione synthase [unclassified Ensifer]|uniref:glutathione synthase n=1 Tax=unclassified Ensifer TaxID=2633371 RepID=UPI00081359C7|nr:MULTISPECIES: glutathione synthase [unclassified Ensifer]OCO99988.1 glutathione synthetase [Ensifer sp. LC13]OCP00075.1 glutathione synthetase [Ensifer sp. LC11]OCP04074.1 glutathione synthetase [Ensifer sp. LC14]OCP30963.1 glutathione synthetase [Ensifer sp. LC499]